MSTVRKNVHGDCTHSAEVPQGQHSTSRRRDALVPLLYIEVPRQNVRPCGRLEHLRKPLCIVPGFHLSEKMRELSEIELI